MATINYGWTLPVVGGSEDTWGTTLNTLWTDLDTLLGGTNATEFAILDGATVTTAELNILDGVTANFNDLNILAGAAAAGVTATEFQYLNGVTSAIQTQIDAKAALASPALTGTPTAPTAASGTATTQIATTAFVDDATITKTTGSPAYYGVRAFAVFDSGASPTVYGQNVASVSRASTGVFNVTFTTAMPDANYAVHPSADRGTIDAYCTYTARTTTGFQVRIFDQNANLLNPSSISVTVIR